MIDMAEQAGKIELKDAVKSEGNSSRGRGRWLVSWGRVEKMRR
jgi:hypothetical protein